MESNVVQMGYQFNEPVSGIEAPSISTLQFFELSSTSLVLDTIKQAGDGTRSLILRFYESYGGRGVARLSRYELIALIMFFNILEFMMNEFRGL